MRCPLFVSVVLLAGVPALAARVVSDEDGGPAPKEANSVYVRDSGVAAEKITLAAKLERQKEWDKAADVYQEVVTKYADRVIATKKDAAGQPSQYVSAAVVVQDKLAGWPADGLAAYRRRYEDRARDLLTAGPDDPAAAQRVMALYFVTDAGRDAALRAFATAFENGDFAAAAYVGRRLLDTHPGVIAERPRVLFQTALAEHLTGDDAGAAKRADELKSRFAAATASLGGADVPLADALARALGEKPMAAGAFASDDWPAPFGSPAASAVPARVSEGGARLFSVEVPVTTPRGANPQAVRSYQAQAAVQREAGVATGILPAVEGGDLFFQDNARVYGISLSNGLPLPGWAATYPGGKHGVYATDVLPMPRGRQLTVSVVGGHVVALLGQYDPVAAASLGYAPQPSQLVSLDRNTGARQWSTTLQNLTLPDGLANLREGGFFYGSPVVSGDSVYVLVHANRGGQFDECYVLALNLGDGKLRWGNYAASASLGTRFMDWDGSGDTGPGVTAQVSLAGERLYVLTNLGALACMDAADGRVVWLNVYPHTGAGPAAGGRNQRFGGPPQMGVAVKPFAIDPPVVADGRVFVLPSDSPDLLVYDAAGGDLVRRVPRQFDKFPPVDMLLAVVGDSVVMANRGTIFRVPWKTYEPAKSLVDNDARYRNLPGPEGGGDTIDALRGRPFVSAKDVLVPTAERLYRIALDSFKATSVYPAQGKWDADESTGNVLATPDNVVVAGPTRVTVYADLAVATAKLDARLAADAGDTDALLRYAELLLSAGDPAGGVARLDQAIDRLGGAGRIASGPARSRVFDTAVNFAVKLQANAAAQDAAKDAVVRLFDRAAVVADTPQQQVRYRTSRAALLRKTNDVDAELALHQQILGNADWRSTAVAGKGGTAGAEAEAAVAELIRQNGDHVYAAYETQAAARVGALTAAEPVDADALLAVADEFPASKQTTDVLAAAADRYEADHKPRRATQTLRRLLQRDLSNERRLVVLQGLARNYLGVPNQLDVALVRLRQARELAPSGRLARPLTFADGRVVENVTVAEALKVAMAYQAAATERRLPGFGVLPAAKPPLRAAAVVTDAVGLIAQQDDLVRNDRVVSYGPDLRVSVVDVGAARIVRADAPLADEPVGCGFVGDTLVVVCGSEVVAFDPAGKTLWRLPAGTLPAPDAAATPASADTTNDQDADNNGLPPGVIGNGINLGINNGLNLRARRFRGGPFGGAVRGDANGPAAADGERFAQSRLLSDRVVVNTTAGRVLAIDLATGRPAWQARPADQPGRLLLSNDDFVVTATGQPGNAGEVHVFDAVTGRSVLHQRYDGNGGPGAGGLVNLRLSPDGVLVTMLSGRLIGRDLYDPARGEWKQNVTGAGDMPFVASMADGQLVIAAGRVLAVHRNKGGQQAVRAYDLQTLKAVTFEDKDRGLDVEASYAPRGNDAGSALSVTASGPAFYIVGPRSLAGYNLDRHDPGWATGNGAGDRGLTRDFVLTQEFAVRVNQIGNPNAAAEKVQAVQLTLFSRALTRSGVESGNIEAWPLVNDTGGVLSGQWQVADGAFFYVSGDGKLKILRANR